MDINVGPITTKKVLVLFLVIIFITTLYLFFTRVDVHEMIYPGPSTWVTQYTNRLDTTEFHDVLSTHIQDPYLISLIDLKEDIQIIAKNTNVEPILIKGFFVSYIKNNDNIIVRITEDDKLGILIMSENINASHLQYFKVYDLSGNISNGKYNITYYNELDQRQIVYIYHEENIYNSVLKDFATSS